MWKRKAVNAKAGLVSAMAEIRHERPPRFGLAHNAKNAPPAHSLRDFPSPAKRGEVPKAEGAPLVFTEGKAEKRNP